jgi:hypothetical protein
MRAPPLAISRRLKAEGTHHLILIIPKSHDCADNVNRVREQDPTDSILRSDAELSVPRAHHLILIFPNSHVLSDIVKHVIWFIRRMVSAL